MAGDELTLVMPAQSRMARVARLTASALGSLVSLSFDDIEDLRTAVSEALVVLLEKGHGPRVTIEFSIAAGCVAFSASTGYSKTAMRDDDLSLQILGVVADEHEVTVGPDLLTVRAVISRPTSDT